MHKPIHLAQCVVAKTENKPSVYEQRIGWKSVDHPYNRIQYSCQKEW